MTERLLEYYRKELVYLKDMAADFGKRHPKVAGHLQIGAKQNEDPHVARLIEAVAFLSARVHMKIDDGYEDFAETLIDKVCPELLKPLPSMAIMQFEPAGNLTNAYEVKAGTQIEVPLEETTARFSTLHDLTVWPIRVSRVELHLPPFDNVETKLPKGIESRLSVTLECLDETKTFGDLKELDSLKFYINEEDQQTFQLYELFATAVESISLRADDYFAELSPVDNLQFSFSDRESLASESLEGLQSLGRLRQFFVFPQKFTFFQVSGLREHLSSAGRKLTLQFYFQKAIPGLERYIDHATLSLHCVPIINLFRTTLEPQYLSTRHTSLHLAAGTQGHNQNEIHEVLTVTATSDSGEEMEYLPFGSPDFHDPTKPASSYFQTRRKASSLVLPGGSRGTETFLQLTDTRGQQFQTDDQNRWLLNIEALCSNRDLSQRLNYAETGRIHFQLAAGTSAVKSIKALTPLSQPLWPELGSNEKWKLVEHLSMSQFASSQGASFLRSLLKNLNHQGTAANDMMIRSLTHLHYKTSAERMRTGGFSALILGHELTIEVDQRPYSGTPVFILVSLLENLFGECSQINSFSQLKLRQTGKEDLWKVWRKKIGAQNLV